MFLRGGPLRTAAKRRLDKVAVRILGVAHIICKGMNVCGALCKGGEQKADIGRSNDPVLYADADAVEVGAVAKPRLGQIDRTDRAQQVGKDLLGFIEFEVIVCLGDDIVCIVEHED